MPSEKAASIILSVDAFDMTPNKTGIRKTFWYDLITVWRTFQHCYRLYKKKRVAMMLIGVRFPFYFE